MDCFTELKKKVKLTLDIDWTSLEGAVRERGTDVEAVEAVGQENQEKALFYKPLKSVFS